MLWKLLPHPYCYRAQWYFPQFDSRRAWNLLNETSRFSKSGFHLMGHECGSRCSRPYHIPRNTFKIGPLSHLLLQVWTGLITHTVWSLSSAAAPGKTLAPLPLFWWPDPLHSVSDLWKWKPNQYYITSEMSNWYFHLFSLHRQTAKG